MIWLLLGIVMFLGGLFAVSEGAGDALLSGLGALLAVIGGWLIGTGIVELIPA